MIMCLQNLVLIGLFVFKILNKNSILTSIKGSNSVANLPKFELMCVHNIMRQFFRRARADNSGVGGGIWPKFELIQAFMHVLTTCKNEDDRIKNEGARVFTRVLPL